MTAAPKVRDLVQIRQTTWLPEGSVARPPVPWGKTDFWIYAEVLELVPGEHDGEIALVRVKVKHPGNHRHAQTLDVKPEDVRTKDDVDALGAQARTPELKRHYAVQSAKLAPGKPKPAPFRAPASSSGSPLTGAKGPTA